MNDNEAAASDCWDEGEPMLYDDVLDRDFMTGSLLADDGDVEGEPETGAPSSEVGDEEDRDETWSGREEALAAREEKVVPLCTPSRS
jgi:hypothetical protein